jgi:hypothetical protein
MGCGASAAQLRLAAVARRYASLRDLLTCWFGWWA